MDQRFPIRRPDGSFSVEVSVSFDRRVGDLNAIQQWIGGWITANGTWQRRLPSSDGPIEVEARYHQSFLGDPSVRISGERLLLRFEGTG